MTTTGAWHPPPRHYDPAAGSGGFLINPPFRIMSNERHPITPPPELVHKWRSTLSSGVPLGDHIATQAARWGADQELEACLLKLDANGCSGTWIHMLRTTRRPKPPSLKEQALADFGYLMGELIGTERHAEYIDTIRRALEALPE